MSTFKPNACTFDEGVERIKTAAEKAGLRWKQSITTSQDSAAKAASEGLRVTNVPDGFKKSQLPVYFDKPSQFYLSDGAPNTDVPKHSHDEGDGLRYIVSGSILYDGKELRAGDWMFVPAGQSYSFKVGPQGAKMFYCYECCCA
jgi:hypothetical protein